MGQRRMCVPSSGSLGVEAPRRRERSALLEEDITTNNIVLDYKRVCCG